MLAIRSSVVAQFSDGSSAKYHTPNVPAVTWAEIVFGVVLIVLLLAGLSFAVLAFLLATIGVGQLELRAVVLFKNWWLSGPLLFLAAIVAVAARHHQGSNETSS